MRFIIYIAMLGSLSGAPIKETFSSEALTTMTAKDFSEKLTEVETKSEKGIVAQEVVTSQRLDLILLALESPAMWTEMIEPIAKLPEDVSKAAIISKILTAKPEVWGDVPKVSNGTRAMQMSQLCTPTLNHYFKNDPVEWIELSTSENRAKLASLLDQAAAGKTDFPKRVKPAMPKPVESSEASFEDGWKSEK